MCAITGPDGLTMPAVGRGSDQSVELITSGLREANTAQEILKPSIGPERIEGRSQQDRRFESRFVCLV